MKTSCIHAGTIGFYEIYYKYISIKNEVHVMNFSRTKKLKNEVRS